MPEKIEVDLEIELSDTHNEWLEEAVEDEHMDKEDMLSQFIAGEELDMQIEEFVHTLYQQNKREGEGQQRRNPMR